MCEGRGYTFYLFCSKTVTFFLQNVEDQHLLMHDQTVIRKGQYK